MWSPKRQGIAKLSSSSLHAQHALTVNNFDDDNDDDDDDDDDV